jgi:threonine aldolase
VHEKAKRVGKMWQDKGGRLTKDVETNQVWIDLKALGVEDEDWNEIGRRQGVSLDGPRIVLHHQIGDEAIRRLEQAFDVVLSRTIEIKSKL